jgi:hypothetical protein
LDMMNSHRVVKNGWSGGTLILQTPQAEIFRSHDSTNWSSFIITGGWLVGWVKHTQKKTIIRIGCWSTIQPSSHHHHTSYRFDPREGYVWCVIYVCGAWNNGWWTITTQWGWLVTFFGVGSLWKRYINNNNVSMVYIWCVCVCVFVGNRIGWQNSYWGGKWWSDKYS